MVQEHARKEENRMFPAARRNLTRAAPRNSDGKSSRSDRNSGLIVSRRAGGP